jgi:hypothetical protein
MLKEEQFHMGTGNNGLRRVIKAGRIPTPIVQRYFNKWIPTAYDLFGVDHSTSAEWAYVWGLKGRYDEEESQEEPDKGMLNDRARRQFQAEVVELVEGLNKVVPEDQPKLFVPDIRFHRAIGQEAGKLYSVRGEELTPEAFTRHLAEVLPTVEDERFLADTFKEKDWIEAKKAGTAV